MRIAFRVDASHRIGAGHVMRCLSLANALRERGAECLFVHREHRGHMTGTIQRFGYPVLSLPVPLETPSSDAETDYISWLGVSLQRDAEDTADVLEAQSIDWLVVDHYALDVHWEQRARKPVRKVAVIDDLVNRQHECEVLIDQTYGRDAAEYRLLVNADCEILTGTKYALLRKAFHESRQQALVKRDAAVDRGVQRILVCMGGVDAENVTLKAINGIRRSGLDVHVDVVVGRNAPNLALLKAHAAERRDFQLHVDTDQMPLLMSSADLAIGAGGTMSWERCCLGLPSLVVITAVNQQDVVASLVAKGAVEVVGDLSSTDIEGCIDDRIEDCIGDLLGALNKTPRRLLAMSLAAREICDGLGAGRAADYFLGNG